jgi:hypothetical protein
MKAMHNSTYLSYKVLFFIRTEREYYSNFDRELLFIEIKIHRAAKLLALKNNCSKE